MALEFEPYAADLYSRKRKRGYEADEPSSPFTALSAGNFFQNEAFVNTPTATPSTLSNVDFFQHTTTITSPSTAATAAAADTSSLPLPPSEPENPLLHHGPFSPRHKASKRIHRALPSKSRYQHQHQHQHHHGPATSIVTTPSQSTTASSPNLDPLSPCHICHRRAHTLNDVSSYASCESCHQRTCFVCIRRCEGPGCTSSLSAGGPLQAAAAAAAPPLPNLLRIIGSGGGGGGDGDDECCARAVCRNCSLEIGAEGMVWCLVCYTDDSKSGFMQRRSVTKEEMQLESMGRVNDWLNRCLGG